MAAVQRLLRTAVQRLLRTATVYPILENLPLEGWLDEAEIPPNRERRPDTRCLQRVLIFSAFAIALLLIGCFSLVIYQSLNKNRIYPFPPFYSPEVCRSKTCGHVSQYMKTPPMGRTINQCEDFLSFMCGKKNPFDISSKYINVKCKSALDRKNPSDREKYVKKIVNEENLKTDIDHFWSGFYKKCLESNTSYENNNDSLRAITKAEGWPSWVDGESGLTNILIKMAKFGVQNFGILNFNLSIDASHYGVHKLFIHNMNSKIISENLVEYFNQIENNDIGFHQETIDIITFMNRLGMIQEITLARSDFYDNKDWANLNDLEKWVPTVEWRRLLNSLVPDEHKNMTVDWDDSVMVYPREYFEKHLAVLLEGTELKTLVTLFHHISTMKALQLLPKANVPERHCDKIMNRILPRIVPLKKSYFDVKEENVEAAMKMAQDVRREFILFMKENKWMDEESINKTVTKLERMSIKNTYNHPRVMEIYNKKRYKNLKLNETETFLDLVLEVLKLNMRTDIMDVIEREELLIRDSEFQCHYHRNLNLLVVGNHGLALESNMPAYYKYATTGFLFGMEMAKMFSDERMKGEACSGSGAIFTNSTMRKFEEKKKCDFSNNYWSEDDSYLRMAREDYVRMNVALQIGYRLNKKVGKQEKLCEFSTIHDDAMFFYSHAKNYCHWSYDKYIPVNHLFSNFDKFAEAFSCEEGSPMNRTKKCTVL